jgi:hypothetical protein
LLVATESLQVSAISTCDWYAVSRCLRLLVNDVVIFSVLARRLRSGRDDVLYQREVPFVNGWACRLQIPPLVEVNGVYVDELHLGGVGGFKSRIILRLDYGLFRS